MGESDVFFFVFASVRMMSSSFVADMDLVLLLVSILGVLLLLLVEEALAFLLDEVGI